MCFPSVYCEVASEGITPCNAVQNTKAKEVRHGIMDHMSTFQRPLNRQMLLLGFFENRH